MRIGIWTLNVPMLIWVIVAFALAWIWNPWWLALLILHIEPKE